MAFKLKSQSPLKQEEDKSKNQSWKPGLNKDYSRSLSSSNDSNKKIVANRKHVGIGDRISQDWEKENPVVKAAVQLVDPTGVSSYGDVKKAWNDGKKDYNDVLEPIGALPLIGKLPKVFKLAKSLSTATRVAQAGSKINKVTSKVNTANKIANQEKVGEAIAQSPLQKQKLSPLAAKKKAARDLAYAKTDDRRIKKAHAQRMHRKNPGKKNMDYDHEDGRFESVKQNRGNEGEGTKKESGKKYKIR